MTLPPTQVYSELVTFLQVRKRLVLEFGCVWHLTLNLESAQLWGSIDV